MFVSLNPYGHRDGLAVVVLQIAPWPAEPSRGYARPSPPSCSARPQSLLHADLQAHAGLRRHRTTLAGKCSSGQPTIQAALEASLAKITGEPIRAAASGRTDSGVHAWHRSSAFAARPSFARDAAQRPECRVAARYGGPRRSRSAAPAFMRAAIAFASAIATWFTTAKRRCFSAGLLLAISAAAGCGGHVARGASLCRHA